MSLRRDQKFLLVRVKMKPEWPMQKLGQVLSKINFIWRKKYLWLFLAIALLGSLLLSLLFGAKLNDLLIFNTLIAVLWYSRETMDLKRNSNREIELLRSAEMNKMIPILLFREGARLHRDGNLSAFQIRNIGSGVAKDISVILSSVEVERNFNLAPGDSRQINIEGHRENVVDTVNQSPEEINMEIRYKDIYERKFRTVEITFTRDDDGNYNLDRGKWKFQILD